MRTFSSVLVVATLTIAAPLFADTPAPATRAGGATAQAPSFAAVEGQHAKLFGAIKPSARSKIEATARVLIFDVAAAQHQARTAKTTAATKPFDLGAAARARVIEAGYYGLEAPSTGDIDALVRIVMFQAAKDADADLRAVEAAMRAVNKAKEALRQGIAAEKALAGEKLRKSDLDEITAHSKAGLDSLSELGETESIRLQMAMDRLSKMMTTLSNILKKNSDTAQSITQNLK